MAGLAWWPNSMNGGWRTVHARIWTSLEIQVYYGHKTAMTIQSPIPDFAAARTAMVDSQLRPQGVTDKRVLDAMASIPRERFVPAAARPIAYLDRSVDVGGGRAIMAPAALASLLTEMAPVPGETALVVGGATGYSAAVLEAIGCKTVIVESDPRLASEAEGNGLSVVRGELSAGYRSKQPYDLILIDGAVEHIPDTFISQLADGGRLGAALFDRGVTRLTVGRKAGGAFGCLTIGDAGVPFLPGFARPKNFTF